MIKTEEKSKLSLFESLPVIESELSKIIDLLLTSQSNSVNFANRIIEGRFSDLINKNQHYIYIEIKSDIQSSYYVLFKIESIKYFPTGFYYKKDTPRKMVVPIIVLNPIHRRKGDHENPINDITSIEDIIKKTDSAFKKNFHYNDKKNIKITIHQLKEILIRQTQLNLLAEVEIYYSNKMKVELLSELKNSWNKSTSSETIHKLYKITDGDISDYNDYKETVKSFMRE